MIKQDAKLILKDKCIDSLIAATNPLDFDPGYDDTVYLQRVRKSLRKLKTHLRKISQNENTRYVRRK